MAFGRDLHAVGSHIGNEPDRLAADVDAFVQALGHLHGLARREAELARGLLLQRRGRERRVRIAPHGLLLHRRDAEVALLDSRLDRVGGDPVLDVELLEPLPGDGVEAGANVLALGRRQQRLDGPVLVGLEGLDLGLAVAYEPQRHRLHAPGRAGSRQLAPEHGREGKADQIVERAARQIGLDQRRLDLPRGLHGVQHGLLGDGIECDALDGDALLEGPFFLQNTEYVPGYCFPFPIRVGGQDEFVGRFDRGGDIPHDFGRLAVDVPVHLEVLVGLHRAVLRGQIAHMAVAGDDLEAGPQVFVDRFGLRGRFHDDDVHAFSRCRKGVERMWTTARSSLTLGPEGGRNMGEDCRSVKLRSGGRL